jgi:2-methylisocitrate lyase-like PEP mutase family enzyme
MSFVNGVRTLEVIGPEELVRCCRAVRRSIQLPILVDFEQGFGEPYVSVYWMKELEAVGVSAVHVDDYGLPYKCPFIPPHVLGLEDMELTAAKIRSMVGERRNKGLHDHRTARHVCCLQNTRMKRLAEQIG